MADFEALKQEMIEKDELFRQLHNEHQAYEEKLSTLVAKSLPSAEDEMQEKQIKIAKLRLKDQMESRLRKRAASS